LEQKAFKTMSGSEHIRFAEQEVHASAEENLQSLEAEEIAENVDTREGTPEKRLHCSLDVSEHK
jgi:hypothetical protein